MTPFPRRSRSVSTACCKGRSRFLDLVGTRSTASHFIQLGTPWKASLPCPVHDLADDGRHLHADGFFIFTGHVGDETFGFVMLHQVDCRAAEAAAGQTRAEAAGMFARQFDENI